MAIEPDAQDAVDHISPGLLLRLQVTDGRLHHLRLLVTLQAPLLDQHDAGVQVAGSRQLHEVVDVAGHQDAVFLVGTLQDLGVGGTEQATLPDVNRVDPLALKLDGEPGRQVLIQQQLHVAPAADQPSGTPG